MKRILGVVIVLIGLLAGVTARSQDSREGDNKEQEDKDIQLEEIVVSGEVIVTPTKQTNDTVYTGSEITRKGIAVQGQGASTSVYNAVDILPGVAAEGADPYGLAAEQRQIRTRGVRGYFGAMTVEGVPNWGGNPIGAREYIYDTENLNGIAVYKGAVPADLGAAVGMRGGAIELRPRWPGKEFGVDFGQGVGENNYTRSFLRVDSGELSTAGTALAVSYSYTEADKWKGPGDLGPRNNAAFMLSQPLGDRDVIKLWYNYNDLEQHLYRPLTYQEARDLHGHYDQDYNEELSGTKAKDIDYYDYNRGEYTNHDVIMIVPVSVSDSLGLTFKPYYSKEDAEILGGATSQGGIIQIRERDIERYGMISQLDWKLSWMTASLGYWYESNDMIIITEMFDPVSFAFKGNGMYTENEGNGIVSSPYLKLAGSLDAFDWQAGVKYFHYTDPASEGYTTPPPDYKRVKAADLYREEKEYEAFLPTAGISYRPSEAMEFYTSYSRNYQRPYSYMPLISLYNQQRAVFQGAGVTLEDLFEGYDMEMSDNYELGARFHNDRIKIGAAVFYSRHDNLLTTVYDPRVNLSYAQNIGEAAGYGAEVEMNAYLGDNVIFFFNPTYTVLTYDDDLTYQGTILDTENNQVVDTPEWTVKSGMILSYKGWEVIPRIRYLGERYGDVEHEEKIDDYIVTDLSVGYTSKKSSLIKALTVAVECNNIFNEEYVSVINSSDDTRAGSSSYHVGAPPTALLKVSMEF